MRINKIKIGLFCILSSFAIISLTCKNKKPVRKLIGEWEVINSTLTLKSSNAVLNYEAKLGNISLFKCKSDLNYNEGSWSFINFPDSIIPSSGNLLWTSTDKDNYVKIPWNMHLIFSREATKGDPNRGGDYFNCYQGYFNVTEIKKKKHYLIEGDIFKTMNDPNKLDYPIYKWFFELKEK
ncbi:MAG: hypothetical protein K9H41_05060 [Bacteroidia bacterium]|nr:hypothetical protein [Bacteroidia bacterium]